ncbi:transposase (plasmid) [Mesorhizobium sp. INR15]|nr:transposase [Mesorhizobium sp. INR15]
MLPGAALQSRPQHDTFRGQGYRRAEAGRTPQVQSARSDDLPGPLWLAEPAHDSTVAEVSQRLGVSPHSLYAWKKKFLKP